MDTKWNSYFCCLLLAWIATSYSEARMNFSITRTWDDRLLNHDSINITLYPQDDVVVMEMESPFFNDPPAPDGEVGKPFPQLWDYEVVEAFFLAQDNKYLEVEFCPHGQHLLLLLNGMKNAIKMFLPVQYTSKIEGGNWSGVARIPKSYFPPNVNRFNAYAIHGSGEERTYEALNPVPTGQFPNPDFHRLEFFQQIDLGNELNIPETLSEIWENAIIGEKGGDTR